MTFKEQVSDLRIDIMAVFYKYKVPPVFANVLADKVIYLLNMGYKKARENLDVGE